MHVDIPPRSRAAPLIPFVPFALGEFHSGIPGCEDPPGRLVCLLILWYSPHLGAGKASNPADASFRPGDHTHASASP